MSVGRFGGGKQTPQEWVLLKEKPHGYGWKFTFLEELKHGAFH